MMNRFLKIVLCCLFCKAAAAQNPQPLFDTANSLYQSQQYDSAAQIYLQLIDQGYDNAVLYYNAGNANYKAGHTGLAVFDYEKALQDQPGNPVILHNLQLANQRIVEKPDEAPTLFFISWWRTVLHLHRPNGWLAGSIIFFWLLLLCAGWRLLSGRKPQWTKWGLYLTGLLFSFYFVCTLARFRQAALHPYAIVMEATVTMKSAPDSGSSDIAQIHEGVKVKVLDAAAGWGKIRLSDGREGWIPAGTMKVL